MSDWYRIPNAYNLTPGNSKVVMIKEKRDKKKILSIFFITVCKYLMSKVGI